MLRPCFSLASCCLVLSLGCSSEPDTANGSGGQGAAAGVGGSTGGTASSGGSGGAGGTQSATGGSPSGGSGGQVAGSGGTSGSGGTTSTGGSGGNAGSAGSATAGAGGSGGGASEATASPGCGTGGRPEGGKVYVAGESWLLFPESYDGETPLPVLFGFHGCGMGNRGDASRTEYSDLTNGTAFEDEYVRAIPVSADAGGCWNYNTDIVRVKALYDELANDYCIDTSRVLPRATARGPSSSCRC